MSTPAEELRAENSILRARLLTADNRTKFLEESVMTFTPAQLTALAAGIAALENSERQTRSACVQLIKLGEIEGAEVMERHANGMLSDITTLKQMAGIECTQHPMPEFASEKTSNLCPVCKGTGDGNMNHEREWIRCQACAGSGEKSA